jgi:hypothetical protein
MADTDPQCKCNNCDWQAKMSELRCQLDAVPDLLSASVLVKLYQQGSVQNVAVSPA